MTKATAFEILPAIDLRGGRVVRLRAGRFRARDGVSSDDPAAVATGFADAGRAWLHVVDLDGARTGDAGAQRRRSQRSSRRSGRASPSRSPAGCGRRVRRRRSSTTGAARAVVGTAALADPALRRPTRRGPRCRTGSRSRSTFATGGRSATAGRRATPGVGRGRGDPSASPTSASRRSRSPRSTATACSADRTWRSTRRPRRTRPRRDHRVRRDHDRDDIRDLRRVGCSGAIIGRALYEGRLAIGDALAAASAPLDAPPSRQ